MLQMPLTPLILMLKIELWMWCKVLQNKLKVLQSKIKLKVLQSKIKLKVLQFRIKLKVLQFTFKFKVL